MKIAIKQYKTIIKQYIFFVFLIKILDLKEYTSLRDF